MQRAEGASQGELICSVSQFIHKVEDDIQQWPKHQHPWFRGEHVPRGANTDLYPTLYRKPHWPKNEQFFLQEFRRRAPAFCRDVPDTGETDKWLFLARHADLPSRLLDWTESALMALYFGLNDSKDDDVVSVWMLNPLQLNVISQYHHTNKPLTEHALLQEREFPLTWCEYGRSHIVPYGRDIVVEPFPTNVSRLNIRRAWSDGPGMEYPYAVNASLVHERMRSQASCFTVHGSIVDAFNKIMNDHPTIWRRYNITGDKKLRKAILWNLHMLGVSDAVAFPDMDGLAKDLKVRAEGLNLPQMSNEVLV